MVAITTEDIKLLRESTGAGILDCKKALQETDGNIDQAIEFLRKKGLAAASKKASREANEGLVSAHISADGLLGVLVEVNCETDFVARTEDFQAFVAAVVQQVANQAEAANVETLLAAPFMGDSNKTVAEKLTETIAKLGENMVIRRVARFELPAAGGMLDSYIHTGGRVGVLVDVAGGSAGDSKFAGLVHDIALQIAAASPRYVSPADVPAEAIEAEKAIYQAQLAEDKKPDNIKERIIEGKLKKWYEEVALVEQPFVKDNDLTIAKLLEKVGKELGGEIKVRRFARFELGAS
ncbi:MAG: elongation factor Ts [Anaerolineae bacterium]|nr:elongation factor Ts [Anaerolineales bacterium]MCQ3973246.1 elongation factor Ts [Anaerolineae bacterium]